MKALLLLCIIMPCTLFAEEVTIQKIETTDGRTLIGKYDEKTNTISIVDEKTLKSVASVTIDPEKIKSKTDLKISKKDADPLDKRGINGKWITNYEVALKLANETHRPILVVLTGSDWCPWCIKLEKEMFSQQKFKEWAKSNVVLLYLDFPQNIKLPKEQVKQNADLQAKWGQGGYPTLYLVNEKGDKYDWKYGYSEGGFEKWLEWIDFSMKKLKK